MLLPFLKDLLSRTPGNQVISALSHTPFDELIVIDLHTGQYESRYHADGKFFSPVNGGVFQSLLDYTSSNLIHAEDQAAYKAFLNCADLPARLRAGDPAGVLSADFRFMALNGEWRLMQSLMVSGPGFGLEERIIHYYLFDVEEIHRREQGRFMDSALPAQSLLSQMPDQTPESAFFSHVQDRLARPLDGRWCLIAVDVKHFKLFKELNGQEKGDHLLIRFASVLHDAARETGGLSCYRGQDDFALLFPFDRFRIDRLFSDLCREIDSLSAVSGFFPVLGIATIEEENSCTALDLFNQAALTAEEIKDDLQYHIRVYDPRVHERHVEEFRLLSEFNDALKSGEITFYLQPQCRVANGKIVGAESLARWRRTDGTFISPVFFIPVLEKYGVVTDLDLHIWESVCRWLRRMIDQGKKPVPISVNVSRIDIFSLDVPAVLSGFLKKYSLPVDLLEVEITESAYVDDSDQLKNCIAALRSGGFRVLMDDFGSGYSSLNMLHSTNMDVIKLDAQFLHFKPGEEQKGINILESVINMTKSLSTPIIVEGVDTLELVQYLTDMGCRYMQGFYFYRPMPGEQFEALLEDPDKLDYNGIRRPIHEQIHLREFLDESIQSDAMLNNILGPVVFYRLRDDNVDIVRFNQQFFRMIGIEPDQMEARRSGIQQYFHKDDINSFFHMLHDAKLNKISGASGYIRVYKPDGALFWMGLHVYYLREEEGGSLFYGSARDMTELMYVNMDLPGGYYRSTTDSSFSLLYISQGFLNMFGYTESELKLIHGNKMLNLIHPDDRDQVVRESEELKKGIRSALTPYRVVRKDGSILYVADQSRLTDRFGETCYQSVLVDITEVMTLRNRMHVLERYYSDCIIFLRDVQDFSTAELVVYGLDRLLSLDREGFEGLLRSNALSLVSMQGDPLEDRLASCDGDPTRANGLYILRYPGCRDVRRVHIRFSLIHDSDLDMSCIFSITPATM